MLFRPDLTNLCGYAALDCGVAASCFSLDGKAELFRTPRGKAQNQNQNKKFQIRNPKSQIPNSKSQIPNPSGLTKQRTRYGLESPSQASEHPLGESSDLTKDGLLSKKTATCVADAFTRAAGIDKLIGGQAVTTQLAYVSKIGRAHV